MPNNTDISAAAAALGRKGGAARTEAKRKASAANGRKGGRPTLRERAAARVDASPTLAHYRDFIMADWPEGAEHWRWVIKAPVAEIVDWAASSM